jgi:hypothetical protein
LCSAETAGQLRRAAAAEYRIQQSHGDLPGEKVPTTFNTPL